MKGSYAQTKRIIIVLLAVASLFISTTLRVPATPPAGTDVSSRPDEHATQPTNDLANGMRVSEAYGKLPMSFEPNRGQTDGRVKFLSRGSDYTLLLTQTEATLALYKDERESDPKSRTHHSSLSSVVRMRLKGANPKPKIEGLEQLPGKSNYLIGNDRAKWHTDIPTFGQVQYRGVYPGIDVVYYGQQGQLEYDFLLAAGADPSKIKIAFAGADNLKIDADGNLILKTNEGEIIQHAPAIYQESETGRRSVDGCYVLRGEREIGFEVPAYDRSKPLVIDPQVIYSTYYGGSERELATGIAVDNGGNAYITGVTFSRNLTLVNPVQGQFGDTTGNPPGIISDAFVTKLNATGTAIVYSTYLGSNGSDNANAIAVTGDGKACITGGTDDTGQGRGTFPIKNAFQGGGTFFAIRERDAFVTVLTADGSDLVYSTYFGGTLSLNAPGDDEGLGIAVNNSGRIVVTGSTTSNDLQTKSAFQSSRSASSSNSPDAFIAKFDPTQSGNASLLYSSYLGGTGTDIGRGVAVDSVDNAYVVGNTFSTDLTTKAPDSLGPIQASNHGGSDAFVAKIDTNSSGSTSLVYSTYFGGAGTDRALAVAVDSSERAYVTGSTDSSTNFTTRNAFQTNIVGGGTDAFVAKFNANGSALFYSTFLGGTGDDEGRGIAIDSAGNAYITGTTTGPDFPTVPAPPLSALPSAILSGNTFITKIEPSDATGTTTPKVLYSDTFGGIGTQGNAIALDSKGNVYIAGSAGANLQTNGLGIFQQQPVQVPNHGQDDAFVVKIGSTFPDTVGVFRPSTGQFLLRNSNTAGNPNFMFNFGQAGDKPVVGDWNGDGVTDIGVFRNGTFLLATVQTTLKAPCLFCIPVLTTTATPLPSFSFGPSGGLPVAGDWNGDGKDTIGVFSNGTFQLRNSNTAGSADLTFGFGAAGDRPVAGDWNGDGIDTVGVFRCAGDCTFTLTNNNSSTDIVAAGFGTTGEVPPPVVGDWNGDGIDSLGVFSPGLGNKFFLTDTNATLLGQAEIQFIFGQAADLPVAGDWNGRPDPFNAPNSGVNDPDRGSSSVGQTQIFTTTCSDPDGWHDISTIDFKIAKSDGQGNGVPLALWVQFNENTNLIRFYDPDLGTWSEGEPGSNTILSSRFADLYLAGTNVQGSGLTGISVQVNWEIVFKQPAVMNNYKQYLKITDDSGLSTDFDKVGSWSVSR